jgi:hypothetical protein
MARLKRDGGWAVKLSAQRKHRVVRRLAKHVTDEPFNTGTRFIASLC